MISHTDTPETINIFDHILEMINFTRYIILLFLNIFFYAMKYAVGHHHVLLASHPAFNAIIIIMKESFVPGTHSS